jgi:hypothetical protein
VVDAALNFVIGACLNGEQMRISNCVLIHARNLLSGGRVSAYYLTYPEVPMLFKRSRTVILMLSAWLLAGVLCRAADELITLVDLMVVYTPEARNAAGGTTAIGAQIQAAVREANLVYLNSRVQMRVRLVHAGELQYPETWFVATDLARLRDSQDGFMDEVHAWRDAYQADLVCLIKERGVDYEYYGLQGPSAANAFSVLLLRSLTGGNNLPVTLSFNFGCQLDRPNADSVGAFPYSYGHVFGSPEGPAYGTVDALQFYRVPWFSNPEIRFQDMACGIPAGKPFAADNSKTLNQTAQFVSAFRGSLVRTRAPSISILSPSGSTGGPLSLIEDTNVTLRFGFSDSDGAVERIELFATADEERTQNFLAAVTNSDTLVLTNIAAGDYVIFAVAFDNMGASSRSSSNLVVSVQPRPPINDNFAEAIELTGTNIVVTGRTTSATLEPGETRWGWPDWNSADASVWYSWTAPASGRMQMEVPGLQPVMGAVVGNSASNFTWIVVNTSGWDGLYTRIEFDVLAGTNYHFFVAGQEIRFTLALRLWVPPVNDDFTYRTVLSGYYAEDVVANYAAWVIKEGEPDPSPPRERSVCTNSAALNIAAEYGAQFDLGSTTAIPLNDNFADRLLITGNGMIAGNNTNATSEVGELRLAGADGKTLWWTFTAPVRGALLISNTNPPPPLGPRGRPCFSCGPAIAMFTGDSITNLTLIASNTYLPHVDNAPPLPWRPLAECYGSVDAGTTCQIMVDSLNNGAWAFSLSFSFLPVPANDSFADREVLSGTNVVVSTQNFATTLEPDEPEHGSTNGGASLWWTWTAPERGMVSLEFVGPFSPLISVYTGGRLDELVRVPFYAQPLWFFTEAGGTYQIAIDSDGAARGIFDWSLVLNPAPANDLFANATQISGEEVIFGGLADYSYREPGEPGARDGLAGSIWYKWKAPVNGHVTLSPVIWSGAGDVYVGSTVSNLMKISVTDSDNYSAFYASAGQTYYIALSDFAMSQSTSCDYMLTSPPLPPRLTPGRRMAGSGMAFEIIGELGQSFVIQASTNLVDWESIIIDTMQGDRTEFMDLSVAQHAARFFRILPLESLFVRYELKLGSPLAAGTEACSVPVFGPAGQPFVLRVSENLSDWSELGRGVISNDRIDVADPSAGEHPVRFYQALSIP